MVYHRPVKLIAGKGGGMSRRMKRVAVVAATGFMPWVFTAPAYAQDKVDPAGGAAVGDVILATVGAIILTNALFAIGFAHRTGRIQFLERAGAWSERRLGMPSWSALPGLISSAALFTALLGMYWDISLHIDQGRDPGPLANPGHYLILAGLFGTFVAGFIAIVLPRERPGRSAIRITRDWYAPVGGVLLLACSAFSLLGFPLDDAWHRLFGQDVTLWGPTHLMLIGGAAMTLIGRSVLLVEGARAARDKGEQRTTSRSPLMWMRFQRASMVGAFLIGLSTFQAEFDFGVPQFRFLFDPAMIMFAAGVALVAARIWAGRGGALLAAGIFVAVRGIVSVIVGPVFGEVTPHLPLYLVEAGIVELVGLNAALVGRPLAFALVSGSLIGTLGLAAEWAWSHVWMPIPWPGSLLPEAAIAGTSAAVAGALIGALIGATLASDRIARPRGAAVALAGSLAIVVAIFGYGLQTSPGSAKNAHITLTELSSAPHRTVAATIELNPRNAADNADWLTVTAWQGGGKLVLDRLDRLGEGIYRTTKPIPVSGEWKAVLRLHRGNSIDGVPIYLPNDPAIPAAEVPASPSFTRQFTSDKKILQREAKTSSAAVVTSAHLAVLAISALLLALLGWGLRRLALDGKAEWRRTPPQPRVRSPRRVMPASP
jgi:hypothetical protein